MLTSRGMTERRSCMGLIALLGFILCSSQNVQASCGDYVYSRYSRMPHPHDNSTVVMQGGTANREHSSANRRSVAGGRSAVWGMFEPGPSIHDQASSVLELFGRTACRGPHCQKAPVNVAVPDGPMVTHRDAKDLMELLYRVPHSDLHGGSLLMANELARPLRGFPLHPEIPPEVA
ncbi:MAG: hypothetical protein JNL58_27125 [Planctomyces sp.]|nr:hypothetical protein [Planctomyces sp.]